MTIQLNPQQELAVNHTNGPALVIAVPGSGKTRLIVERIGRLIDSGVEPSEILCLTFTNKAANEMKNRLAERCPTVAATCFIGTFHKFGIAIIRKFGLFLGYAQNFTILDSDDQKDIVQQILMKKGIEIPKDQLFMLIKMINNSRENIQTEKELEDYINLDQNLKDVIPAYIEKIKDLNAIDFSGILSETLVLLKDFPIAREFAQNRFRYIHVDECQDTNGCQFEIIKYISNSDRNVMMVGDISQSIYKFRGAQYKNVIKFVNDHSDCKRYDLQINYRSTPQIIKAADTLIKNNSSHIAADFMPHKPLGEEVVVQKCSDQFHEADYVASYIRKLLQSGFQSKDIAILYRLNKMSDNVERALAASQIKYKVVGSRSFYDRKEIKDGIAFLAFHSNPKNLLAFQRICNTITGIGSVTIGHIDNLADLHSVDILEASRIYCSEHQDTKITQALEKVIAIMEGIDNSLSVHDKYELLLEKFDYFNYLERYDHEKYEDRIDNVNEFLNSIGKFFDDNPNATIDYFLQSISIMSDSDEVEDEDKVTLITIHSAKGMEYPVVFLIGLEQGTLPHFKSFDSKEDLEEERRLCYVGITRAKSLLVLSYYDYRVSFGKNSDKRNIKSKPSQFLAEANLLR